MWCQESCCISTRLSRSSGMSHDILLPNAQAKVNAYIKKWFDYCGKMEKTTY